MISVIPDSTLPQWLKVATLHLSRRTINAPSEMMIDHNTGAKSYYKSGGPNCLTPVPGPKGSRLCAGACREIGRGEMTKFFFYRMSFADFFPT